MHIPSSYEYRRQTDYKLLGGCLAAVLVAVVIAIPIVIKLKSKPDPTAKLNLTPEQRAVIAEFRSMKAEVESLRGELNAARASVPPGQEVIFWWENGQTISRTDNGKKHEFGLRADGVLVWKY